MSPGSKTWNSLAGPQDITRSFSPCCSSEKSGGFINTRGWHNQYTPITKAKPPILRHRFLPYLQLEQILSSPPSPASMLVVGLWTVERDTGGSLLPSSLPAEWLWGQSQKDKAGVLTSLESSEHWRLMASAQSAPSQGHGEIDRSDIGYLQFLFMYPFLYSLIEIAGPHPLPFSPLLTLGLRKKIDYQ